ncbi:MAG: hypothetical protein ABI894_14840, partial [Ilumatobacteraceae bacterium]
MSARSVGVDPGLGRLSLPADHVAPARIPTEAELHQFVAEPESRRHHVWIAVVLACLLLGGGLFGSQLAAASVAKRNSERSQQALELSAVEIASKLRLSLQRQEDLAISAAAFFLARPFASNDQFRA